MIIKSVGLDYNVVVLVIPLESGYFVYKVRNPVGNLRMNQIEKLQRSVGYSFEERIIALWIQGIVEYVRRLLHLDILFPELEYMVDYGGYLYWGHG